MDIRQVLDARKTYGRRAIEVVMCENQNLARSSLKRGLQEDGRTSTNPRTASLRSCAKCFVGERDQTSPCSRAADHTFTAPISVHVFLK